MSEDEYPLDPLAIKWEFGREPIDWGDLPGRYLARYELAPHKIELIDGKLFWEDDVRLLMVGLLLENLGLDKVMQLAIRARGRKPQRHCQIGVPECLAE